MTDELFAKINNINICYEISGEVKPIILIHGFGSRKEGWFCQIGALSQRYQVITIDLRNSGKTDHPNDPITMEQFVEDIKGLMDFLNINQVSLVGESMGGMIGLQFALMYPNRLNKLILINTTYSSDWLTDILLGEQIRSIEIKKQDPEKHFWDQAVFLYHQKIRRQMQSDSKRKFYDLWSVEDLIKKDLDNPITAQDLRNQASALRDFNVYNRLSEIKNKTLIIAASHDRVFPISIMKEMNRSIPNSELKIIKNAGHGSSTSRAPEINQIILEFLDE